MTNFVLHRRRPVHPRSAVLRDAPLRDHVRPPPPLFSLTSLLSPQRPTYSRARACPPPASAARSTTRAATGRARSACAAPSGTSTAAEPRTSSTRAGGRSSSSTAGRGARGACASRGGEEETGVGARGEGGAAAVDGLVAAVEILRGVLEHC